MTIADGHVSGDVLQLLDAVHKDILAHAAAERPALQAYLRAMGLDGAERAAIVDVGYSATIQDRLHQFASKQVHGYYMMTVAAANAVRDRHGSIAAGCFADRAKDWTGGS